MYTLCCRATILYDRPPAVFQPILVFESHRLFASLAKQYPVFRANDSSVNTVFTELLSDNDAVWRKDRPGLIVSSTSWTDDEDFSVLLSALQGSIFKIEFFFFFLSYKGCFICGIP